MELIYGHDKFVSNWVAYHIKHASSGFGEMSVAIGILDGSNLIAGFVFNEYKGNDIHVSGASITPKWATRKILRSLFDYAFNQAKCDRLSAKTLASDNHTINILERLGFKKEGVIRRGFKNDDCVFFGILREECKFLEVKNGKLS